MRHAPWPLEDDSLHLCEDSLLILIRAHSIWPPLRDFISTGRVWQRALHHRRWSTRPENAAKRLWTNFPQDPGAACYVSLDPGETVITRPQADGDVVEMLTDDGTRCDIRGHLTQAIERYAATPACEQPTLARARTFAGRFPQRLPRWIERWRVRLPRREHSPLADAYSAYARDVFERGTQPTHAAVSALEAKAEQLDASAAERAIFFVTLWLQLDSRHHTAPNVFSTWTLAAAAAHALVRACPQTAALLTRMGNESYARGLQAFDAALDALCLIGFADHLHAAATHFFRASFCRTLADAHGLPNDEFEYQEIMSEEAFVHSMDGLQNLLVPCFAGGEPRPVHAIRHEVAHRPDTAQRFAESLATPLNPRMPRYLAALLYGRLLNEQGRHAAAEATLRGLLQRFSAGPETPLRHVRSVALEQYRVRSALAKCLGDQGKTDEGLQHAQHAAGTLLFLLPDAGVALPAER